jgi:hypothetical protein
MLLKQWNLLIKFIPPFFKIILLQISLHINKIELKFLKPGGKNDKTGSEC